jgi:hypothetical protein
LLTDTESAGDGAPMLGVVDPPHNLDAARIEPVSAPIPGTPGNRLQTESPGPDSGSSSFKLGLCGHDTTLETATRLPGKQSSDLLGLDSTALRTE